MLRLMLTSAALAGGALSTPTQEVFVDYPGTPVTEASYRFQCGGTKATLAFREERKEERAIPRLADRWRIAFEKLSISGGRISPPDGNRLAEALHRFSWLTLIRGVCNGNGGYEITLEGMSAEAWADYNEGRLRERPGQTRITIRLTRSGGVTIF